MRFLLLHGWQGSGPEHWQSWLARRLSGSDHDVAYPRMPEAEDPRPEAWDAVLNEELNRSPSVVICHSMGCVLWLRHAAALAAGATPEQPEPVERVLLVAPPCRSWSQLPAWQPFPLDAAGVAAAAGHTRLVCSDDDPYCPRGAAAIYGAPLDVPVDLLPGAGHINSESGFGPWPAVEAWAYGAKNGVET